MMPWVWSQAQFVPPVSPSVSHMAETKSQVMEFEGKAEENIKKEQKKR